MNHIRQTFNYNRSCLINILLFIDHITSNCFKHFLTALLTVHSLLLVYEYPVFLDLALLEIIDSLNSHRTLEQLVHELSMVSSSFEQKMTHALTFVYIDRLLIIILWFFDLLNRYKTVVIFDP